MTKYIVSLVLLICAGAAFVLYTRPAYDGVQTKLAENAQYDGALNKAAQLQAVKQGLLDKYNKFPPNDLERLQKLLPDHVDNVALILDLDNLASHYGLGLENVDVSAPASAQTSKTAVGAVGAAGLKYDSLNIKFSTHATYQKFTEFLGDLQASLRVVDLVSLSISPGSGTGEGGEPVYNFSIALRTYWLK
jgi:Tfp pilus assembly protein PilO